MSEVTKKHPLTEDKIEKLAKRLFKWCVKHDYWQDITIAYNGKSIGTYNPITNEYYYGQDKYYENPSVDPKLWTEDFPSDATICITMEGPFNHLMNSYSGTASERKQVRKLFEDQELEIFVWNCYMYAYPKNK